MCVFWYLYNFLNLRLRPMEEKIETQFSSRLITWLSQCPLSIKDIRVFCDAYNINFNQFYGLLYYSYTNNYSHFIGCNTQKIKLFNIIPFMKVETK